MSANRKTFQGKNNAHRKRAKKYGCEIDNTVTVAVLRSIYDTPNCGYCHKPTVRENRTLDHIMPLIRGGKHSKHNLLMSCHKCNHRKSCLTHHEMTVLQGNGKAYDRFYRKVNKISKLSLQIRTHLAT